MAGGGLLVFLALVRWAWGPFPWPPSLGESPMNSVFRNLHSDPDADAPWVRRARLALARLPPPPPPSNELPGWSWRPVDREPAMTVRVDDRSSDGRRISGCIIGTPGTLAVTCSARTELRLVQGWITLTPDGSAAMTLRPGDSLLLHPGFSGSWQNDTVAHLGFEVTLT